MSPPLVHVLIIHNKAHIRFTFLILFFYNLRFCQNFKILDFENIISCILTLRNLEITCSKTRQRLFFKSAATDDPDRNCSLIIRIKAQQKCVKQPEYHLRFKTYLILKFRSLRFTPQTSWFKVYLVMFNLTAPFYRVSLRHHSKQK